MSPSSRDDLWPPSHSSPLVVESSKSTPLPRRVSKRPPLTVVPPPMPSFRSPSSASAHDAGVFLVSPPPTATQMPKHDVLRHPRVHQTFEFTGAGKLPPLTVGFAEYGDLDGYPTIVIGGHGCTRLVGVMFEEFAQKHNLRMIWPERPGYGLSQECDMQKLNALDWSEVVIQLADHLKLTSFSMIAQSVGTVFAMAVAYRYPGRVVGPIYCISPWVSTVQANTFKWTRRLPASLISKTLSFAIDIIYLFNRPESTGSTASAAMATQSTAASSSSPATDHTPPFSPSSSSQTIDDENEFLAALENDQELPTDFPPHRPLRHMVRPRHISLYVAMNKLRMQEPYHNGQLGDILIALEKYHPFGFSYNQVTVAVSAVWGDKDALIPQRSMHAFANQLTDIRLKILEGEGHDLVWKEGVMTWAIRGIGERWRAR